MTLVVGGFEFLLVYRCKCSNLNIEQADIKKSMEYQSRNPEVVALLLIYPGLIISVSCKIISTPVITTSAVGTVKIPPQFENGHDWYESHYMTHSRPKHGMQHKHHMAEITQTYIP